MSLIILYLKGLASLIVAKVLSVLIHAHAHITFIYTRGGCFIPRPHAALGCFSHYPCGLWAVIKRLNAVVSSVVCTCNSGSVSCVQLARPPSARFEPPKLAS